MEMLNGSSTRPEEEKKIKGEHKGVEIKKDKRTKDGTHLKTEGRTKVKKVESNFLENVRGA